MQYQKLVLYCSGNADGESPSVVHMRLFFPSIFSQVLQLVETTLGKCMDTHIKEQSASILKLEQSEQCGVCSNESQTNVCEQPGHLGHSPSVAVGRG